jgi:ribose transport system substrate-binding protein
LTIRFDRRIRVGVTEKNLNPYWDMVNAGWQDAAEALGLDLVIEAPPSEDPAEQEALMRRQLDAGVDALAFVATRRDGFRAVVAEARSRGIPVVAFDLDAPESGRLSFVGMPGLYESGIQIGEFLHERIPAGSPVIAQTGSDHAPGAGNKLRGFLDAMERLSHPVVTADSDGEDVERSTTIAVELLAAHPDTAGMFGVYGYHPIVQAHAVERAGLAGQVVIVGYDMLPETVRLLEQGAVASSVWIQEYYFGFHTAQLIADIVRLGPESLRAYGMDPDDPVGNAYYPPFRFFTPETVHEFIAFRDAKRLDTRTAATVA